LHGRCGVRHNAFMPLMPPLFGDSPAAQPRAPWLAALSFAVVAAVSLPALAQAPAKPVYRCPGPPVLYTDSLSAQEARERGCRTIEAAPVPVGPAPRARPPASAARPGDARVDPAAQRNRDSDARRILADELQSEQSKLDDLRKEYNGGQPERLGSERNYQRYLDRVAEMKAAIERKEADVAALKRELAKLPQ
jgi:hypothetical protein